MTFTGQGSAHLGFHVFPLAQHYPAWLDGLFPTDRDQAGAGSTQWLDRAQAALHTAAIMETSLYSRQELDEGRIDGRASISLGV
jgi:hypothetical protein